jgi:hypothetical protein
VSQQEPKQQVSNSVTAQSSSVLFQEELVTDKELADFAGGKSYQLPVLADSILERGMSLIGTRYRFGGALKPGDLLFFATNGRRGRVSHAGIYLGDNQFIHSSSRKSGGVRIDSLGDSYWSKTFIEAKRALAMAPTAAPAIVTARK